jgi:hypothetical protein
MEFFYPLGHDPPKIKKISKVGGQKNFKIFDPLKTTFLHISDHLGHFWKKKFQWKFCRTWKFFPGRLCKGTGQYGNVTVKVRDASERYKSTVVHQIGAAEGDWMSNGVETPLAPPVPPPLAPAPRPGPRYVTRGGQIFLFSHLGLRPRCRPRILFRCLKILRWIDRTPPGPAETPKTLRHTLARS